MKNPILLLIGGTITVIISAIAIYIDTGSSIDVIEVLLLKKVMRVGISIPFGYFFIIFGAIQLFYYRYKRKK